MTPVPLVSAPDKQCWDRDGYLHLPGMLSASLIGDLREALARTRRSLVDASRRARGRLDDYQDPLDCNITGLLALTDEADHLIDHPVVLDIALGLMGPYVQVTGVEAFWRYPRQQPALGLHTDGGPALAGMFVTPNSRVLQLKVQYFLTDVPADNHGNLVVAPGSHRRPFPIDNPPPVNDPQLTQLTVNAGDAVVFPWALWHGVAANRSTYPRESIVVRYAQRWIRVVDETILSETRVRSLTPAQRVLLAGFIPGGEIPVYYPSIEEFDDLLGPDRAGRSEVADWRRQHAFYLGLRHDQVKTEVT